MDDAKFIGMGAEIDQIRKEAASWRRVAERLEGEKQALARDDLRSMLKPCPEEANEALCGFPSCTCAAERLRYEPSRVKASAWLVSNGEAGDDLRYRMWSGRAWVWTSSLAQAAHFARRQDAKQILPDGDEHGQRVVTADGINPRDTQSTRMAGAE